MVRALLAIRLVNKTLQLWPQKTGNFLTDQRYLPRTTDTVPPNTASRLHSRRAATVPASPDSLLAKAAAYMDSPSKASGPIGEHADDNAGKD